MERLGEEYKLWWFLGGGDIDVGTTIIFNDARKILADRLIANNINRRIHAETYTALISTRKIFTPPADGPGPITNKVNELDYIRFPRQQSFLNQMVRGLADRIEVFRYSMDRFEARDRKILAAYPPPSLFLFNAYAINDDGSTQDLLPNNYSAENFAVSIIDYIDYMELTKELD